jgi:hypothetical protein
MKYLDYIVIGERMFVWRITHYDKVTNKAQLRLYQNPADFRSGKTLKQITVGDWR